MEEIKNMVKNEMYIKKERKCKDKTIILNKKRSGMSQMSGRDENTNINNWRLLNNRHPKLDL